MSLPSGFVYLHALDASIHLDIRYYTDNNFLGVRVAGYKAPVCILTSQAAKALATIQAKLMPLNLSLKVFDGYRPQMAVDHFIAWSADVTDQKMKVTHYPNINKKDFFVLNYIAAKSTHTRGSTVDLTLIKVNQAGQEIAELDMGTIFDFMDELSHPLTGKVAPLAKQNRLYLRQIMQEAGFIGIDTEWWHFTLADEPFPDTYFNFPVK